jgi:hypothetical protein
MRSSCGLTRSSRWLRTRQTPTTALSRMASPSCFARSVSVTSRVVITATASPSQSNAAAVISTKCCAGRRRTRPRSGSRAPSPATRSRGRAPTSAPRSRQKPSSTPLRPITCDFLEADELQEGRIGEQHAAVAHAGHADRVGAEAEQAVEHRLRALQLALREHLGRRVAADAPPAQVAAGGVEHGLAAAADEQLLAVAVTNWITRSRYGRRAFMSASSSSH